MYQPAAAKPYPGWYHSTQKTVWIRHGRSVFTQWRTSERWWWRKKISLFFKSVDQLRSVSFSSSFYGANTIECYGVNLTQYQYTFIGLLVFVERNPITHTHNVQGRRRAAVQHAFFYDLRTWRGRGRRRVSIFLKRKEENHHHNSPGVRTIESFPLYGQVT